MVGKKISRFMSICMGVTMSFTMSLIGSLIGTIRSGHFTVGTWLASFAASFGITVVVAIALGFIVPMDKIKESIGKKSKTKGFKVLLLQSLSSDLIYTTIISLIMAFFTTAVFSLPNAKKGCDNAITEIAVEKAETQVEIAKTEIALEEAKIKDDNKEMVAGFNSKLEGLKGKIGGLTAAMAEKEQEKADLKYAPMAFKNFALSYPIELFIALIIIMIVEPRFQKKAFQKYIPKK